jgi:hypothetical protein
MSQHATYQEKHKDTQFMPGKFDYNWSLVKSALSALLIVQHCSQAADTIPVLRATGLNCFGPLVSPNLMFSPPQR